MLSPQQERLLGRANSACRALCLIEATGEVEAAALGRALCAVVARHEILRTTFQALPGQRSALQVVGDGAPCALRYLDLAQSEPAAQQARLTQVFDQLEREPLDLARGPALTAAILTLAPGRQVLCLCLPALCADAPTLRLLVDQVATGARRRLRRGRADPDLPTWRSGRTTCWPPRRCPHPLQRRWRSPRRRHAARAVVVAGRRLRAAVRGAAARPPGGRGRPGGAARRLADAPAAPGGPGRGGDRGARLRPRRSGPGGEALGPLARYLPLPPPASGTSFTERVAAAAAGLRRAEAEQDLAPAGGAGSFSFCFDFDQLPAAVPGRRPRRPRKPSAFAAPPARHQRPLPAQGGGHPPGRRAGGGAVLRRRERACRGSRAHWAAGSPALLGNALEAPDAPAAELSLLTPAARRQVAGLAPGRPARGDWGPDATLPRLCWEQARRTPHAVALAGGGLLASPYAELDDARRPPGGPPGRLPGAGGRRCRTRASPWPWTARPEMVTWRSCAIQRAGAALRAARSRLPARPPRVHAGRFARRAAGEPGAPPATPASPGVATRVLCLAAGGPAAAAAAAPPAPPEAWPSPADLART